MVNVQDFRHFRFFVSGHEIKQPRSQGSLSCHKKEPWGQFNKTFTSVNYKCNH